MSTYFTTIPMGYSDPLTAFSAPKADRDTKTMILSARRNFSHEWTRTSTNESRGITAKDAKDAKDAKEKVKK
jgi:hypothetical protein